MLRAKPLIIWCLGGRAIALSVSRRTFAIGTAAAPFAAYADVPAQTYDGLYVVEGSKSRRRVVTRDGAVVVEAEERGQWRALESSADSDGLLVCGRVEIKFRRLMAVWVLHHSIQSSRPRCHTGRRQARRLREREKQRRAGLHGPGDLSGGQHPLVRRRALGAEARVVS